MDDLKKPDINLVKSERKGVGGFAENFMREFKIVFHLLMIAPLYLVGAACIGAALLPGFYLFNAVSDWTAGFSQGMRFWLLGSSLGLGYFMYGFSMIVLVPTLNFIFRASLKEWRGPYYSLPAVRWYIHNGLTYVVRFTFLEFITPTPFNIFFFRMMGMKIGEGTLINSSHLSDPSLIELGRKVTLGGSVTIVAHYGQGGFLVLAPVKIGDKATIGLRAILMGGVTIGEGAKILPNSVVLPKTQVPAGETWGGVPARKMEAHELVKAA
jgi:hypothetical protein